MKMVKKFLVCLLFAAPVLFVPKQSKAGEDNGNNKDNGNHYGENKNNASSPTSVPLDGGLIILMAAGLGLGAKLIYDVKRSNGKQVIA